MSMVEEQRKEQREILGDALLNSKQVGIILGIAPRKVGEYVRRGWLHGRKVGRGYLVYASSVQSLVGLPEGENKAEKQEG